MLYDKRYRLLYLSYTNHNSDLDFKNQSLATCGQKHAKTKLKSHCWFISQSENKVNKRTYKTDHFILHALAVGKKGKGSPYSITERRVPEPIPVPGSQPARDVSHKPGGRLPLLSARPTVTLTTLKTATTNFAAW